LPIEKMFKLIYNIVTVKEMERPEQDSQIIVMKEGNSQ